MSLEMHVYKDFENEDNFKFLILLFIKFIYSHVLETDPTISKLNKLSEVLDVSPLDILTFEEKIPFINQQYNQNNEEVIICHTYHNKEKLEEKLKYLEKKIELLEDKFGK